MGLLSFRKKSSDDESAEKAAPEAVDEIGSNLSNDEWLAGVERREPPAAPEPETAPDPSYDYPTAEPTDAVDPAPAESASISETPVPSQAPMSAAPTQSPMSQAPGSPDMGIVYAGLENEGVATFPSEASPAPAAPAPAPAAPFPAEEPQPVTAEAPAAPIAAPAAVVTPEPVSVEALEHGPAGPEATGPMQTLGLAPGCSWADVATTRQRILAAIPNTGAPEEASARNEVNHSAATLRLLRVGPLKS